jgi:hypothetical protein
MPDLAKSSAEIEDVLSSIRRLVAEHHPGPNGSTRPAQLTMARAGADKLVLTPALRVADGDDPFAAVTPQMTADDNAHWTADDRLASWDEVGIAAADDAAGPDHVPAPRSPDAVADAAHTDDGLDAAVVGVFDDRNDDPDHDPILAEDMEDLIRLDGAEHASAYEAEGGDNNWPDDGAGLVAAHIAAKRGGVAETDAALKRAAQDNAPTSENTQPSADKPEPDAMTAAADIADQQLAENDATAKDGTPSKTSDDTAGGGADPEFTPIFSRRSAAHQPPRQDDRVIDLGQKWDSGPDGTNLGGDVYEDLGEDASPFSFPDDDNATMDEETLREIIAEVVREELQGVLGQRITRNVRKMVRREIRLALAAEDLE